LSRHEPRGLRMPYDEQVEPVSDPPVVDDPPVTVQVGHMLSHTEPPRTEVLVPIAPLPAEERTTRSAGAEAAGEAAPEVAAGLVRRHCDRCGTRYDLPPDTSSCPLGHQISPAHARRRWWQRRRR
jgi:hypothetical protein